MDAVQQFEKSQIKKDIPKFDVGDTIRVEIQVVEGERTRTQGFEGVLIRRKGGGCQETLTVRKVSYGVGVERIFPIHSPRVTEIKLVRRGKARRAKLYYLRGIEGKKARLKVMRKRA